MFHANSNQKRAWVAIWISHKIELNSKTVKKVKEGNYILIKESILKGDIAIINIYTYNRTSKYIRQKLTELNGEIVIK